jgi:glutamate synthase domain-containing protein 2
VVFALDISDMPAPEFATELAQILDILEFLYPAAEKQINTQARILTSKAVGAVSGIDIASGVSVTSIGVDFSTIDGPDGGNANQQLVEDIGFTGTTSGVVTLNVTREKRYFRVVNTGANNFWEAFTPNP